MKKSADKGDRERWRQQDDADRRLFDKDTEKAMGRSAIDRDLFAALRTARASIWQSDLMPCRNADGDLVYRIGQGLKAACYAREDAQATFLVQRAVLARLDRNYRMQWWLLAVLAYIAYRLS